MERVQVYRRSRARVLACLVALVMALLAVQASGNWSTNASAQAATDVDLALIITKRGLQEHVVDISVNPPKTHLRILLKNQGSTLVTAIDIAHRVPDGMRFASLSAPPLPITTMAGNNVAVERTADDHVLIDQLAAGDSLAIDVTLDIVDKTPGRFVNAAEVVSMAGPQGEPARDIDSTPDGISGNDEIENTPGIDADDPENSHNDISYDQSPDGQSFPTPNDEDDHDTEVVEIPPVINASLFLDPDTSTPLAPGQPVTFLVDLLSVGAPAQTIEVTHAIDATMWAPFELGDSAVSSYGGRDVVWSFEDGGVTSTVTGSLPNGERDLFPVTLTPLDSFSGLAGELNHSISIARVNDAAPHVGSAPDSVEGGVVRADATAEMLDVALRLSVNATDSDLPPLPGSAIALTIDVTNQGSVPVSGLRVFSHIEEEMWERIDLADNPPSTTLGDAALGVVWEADEFGAEATVDGQLAPGQTITLAATLRISDAFTNPFGYLSTEAEISAVTATSASGQPLYDVDSEPDTFNYDATVDDVTNNDGGDEDDHDTAFINQRFAVGNQAWVDTDGDGLRGASEDALGGLELELYKTADDLGVDVTATQTAPVAATTTDDAGMYLFDGLEPGSYVIRIAESAREVGGAAYGLSPTAAPTATIGSDGDNDARIDASGRIVAGPFVLGDGLPEGEFPRIDGTTVDGLDDLTIDIGLVRPQAAEGSQDPDSNPPQLAFTGAAHRVLILLGMFLIVSGSIAVRASGRR